MYPSGKTLKLMKKLSLLAFVSSIAASVATIAPAQSVETNFLGPNKQIVRYQDLVLTDAQQSKLEKFSSRIEYFGGFAVNTENGAWGYSAGFFSQDFAEQAAVKICEGNSRGRPCTLIAAVLPASLPSAARNAFGFNKDKEDYYRSEFLPKVKRQKAGRYAAFAIGSRALGYETNAKSSDVARLKARRKCERAEASNRKQYVISVRNAISALDGQKCKVIEVIGPS